MLIIGTKFEYVLGKPVFDAFTVRQAGEVLFMSDSPDLLVAWQQVLDYLDDDAFVMFSSSFDEFFEYSDEFACDDEGGEVKITKI
jgi:hypothetical protein